MHPALVHSRPFAIALAVAGATLVAAPIAVAQPGAQSSTAQEVTVVAPKVARHHYAGMITGAPVEVVSLTRTVSYADLDLTKQSDVATFESRVQTTAQAACDELERQYPSTFYVLVPANQNCFETASDRAMALAKDVIAASAAGGSK